MKFAQEIDCVTPTFGDDWEGPKPGPLRPLDAETFPRLPKELINKNGRAIVDVAKKKGVSNTTRAELTAYLAQAGDWVRREVLAKNVSCALPQMVTTLSNMIEDGAIERRRINKNAEYRLVGE